jgi:hypothetical protein
MIIAEKDIMAKPAPGITSPIQEQVEHFVMQHLFEPVDQFVTTLEARFATHDVKVLSYDSASHIKFSVGGVEAQIDWWSGSDEKPETD